jgi:Cdc6-like AAA superfamily ATPase
MSEDYEQEEEDEVETESEEEVRYRDWFKQLSEEDRSTLCTEIHPGCGPMGIKGLRALIPGTEENLLAAEKYRQYEEMCRKLEMKKLAIRARFFAQEAAREER